MSTDRLLRGAIRFCMLTGVTFLVTACYGVQPRYTDEEQAVVDVQEQLLEDTIKSHE